MSTTPLPPPNHVPLAPSSATSLPSPPGTEMTGICFKDPLWLSTYPLDRNLVFDYFALSPFYDFTCNNEQLRSQSIHPLDLSHLTKMTGIEYMLSEVTEPHLFVIRKQKRDSSEKVTPMLIYYILDGSIYQAPQLGNVFASRISRAIYHISKAFAVAESKLEKIGYVAADSENEDDTAEKETINFKELKRVDHILSSVVRKLPPAPPPPPFPEGYTPPSSESEKALEDQQNTESQLPNLDPIVDQGPSKRTKYQLKLLDV